MTSAPFPGNAFSLVFQLLHPIAHGPVAAALVEALNGPTRLLATDETRAEVARIRAVVPHSPFVASTSHENFEKVCRELGLCPANSWERAFRDIDDATAAGDVDDTVKDVSEVVVVGLRAGVAAARGHAARLLPTSAEYDRAVLTWILDGTLAGPLAAEVERLRDPADTPVESEMLVSGGELIGVYSLERRVPIFITALDEVDPAVVFAKVSARLAKAFEEMDRGIVYAGDWSVLRDFLDVVARGLAASRAIEISRARAVWV